MILDGIDVFAEVVEAQSFSKAARRLGMPTSTVSAKIARLEERLGVTLIRRTTRQVSVTAEGRSFYARCVRALAELDLAERELADRTDGPKGRLTISAAADLVHYKLVPLVETYLETYPGTSIDLKIANERADLLADGIDLAIRVGHLPDSSLIARRFFTAHVGLWASSGYLARHGTPESIKDLAQHQLVLLNRAEGVMRLYDPTGTEIAYEAVARLTCDDMQSCRAFVETGAGIGLLPDFIGTYPATPLVPVLPEITSRPAEVHFVYPEQRFVPRALRAFIDIAADMSGQPPQVTTLDKRTTPQV